MLARFGTILDNIVTDALLRDLPEQYQVHTGRLHRQRSNTTASRLQRPDRGKGGEVANRVSDPVEPTTFRLICLALPA
jgi:hypothetical protein